jgi:hypothetical protein
MNRTTAAKWMLVLSALPAALVLFLIIFGSSILRLVEASSPNPYLADQSSSNLLFFMIVLSWLFSLVTGCVVLIIDCVLILRKFVSLKQVPIIVSVFLALADVVFPVGIVLLIINAFKNFHMWP